MAHINKKKLLHAAAGIGRVMILLAGLQVLRFGIKSAIFGFVGRYPSGII